MKDDLETAQDTRGFLTIFTNGVKEVFGGGDSAAEKKIAEYEELLSSLRSTNAQKFIK